VIVDAGYDVKLFTDATVTDAEDDLVGSNDAQIGHEVVNRFTEPEYGT